MTLTSVSVLSRCNKKNKSERRGKFKKVKEVGKESNKERKKTDRSAYVYGRRRG